MKKTILTLAVLGAIASQGFSQGWVNFSAGTSASTRISTNAAVGSATGAGLTAANATQLFYYALFASAANTAVGSTSAAISGANANYVVKNLTGWSFVGYATNGAAGRVVSFGPNSDNSYSVAGIAGGATAQFVLLGWSANVGATTADITTWINGNYASAQGWIGQSAVSGALALGDGSLNITPAVFGGGTGQLGGFVLGLTPPVPEPGTLALAALGFGSLLALRRKK